MSFGPREKVPRVALRLQKPKGVAAPKGWEGAVSVWRLKEGRSLERIFISKFDCMPVNVNVRVPREMIDVQKGWVLVVWLREIDDEPVSRLFFADTHNVTADDISELRATDFLKSSKNVVKNALWTRTDFRALLQPSRTPDGKEVMIAPPYHIKQCRLQTPAGVLAQWKLRIVLGRLMYGDEAYSPDSSDGIDSEKEEPMPTYHVDVDSAIQRKPKGFNGVKLFHASTHAPLTDAELICQLNGEPLSDMEEDRQWLVHTNAELVDEYVDVGDEDKAFFKLWNAHVIPVPPVKRDIPTLCKTFMEANRKRLRELNLRLSLLQHLLHLLECRLLGRFTFLSCMEYFETGKWPK